MTDVLVKLSGLDADTSCSDDAASIDIDEYVRQYRKDSIHRHDAAGERDLRTDQSIGGIGVSQLDTPSYLYRQGASKRSNSFCASST